jgi:pimeloyl-ACP methyl ester carboxylesterase
VSGADEQFLVFNFQNPVALRDNVRQSALELALMPDVLDDVTIDVSDCAGAVAPLDQARFDTGTMALMGHSMGAAIAPLTLAYEPRYRAGLLSGAGGSFRHLMYKLKPLPAKSFGVLLARSRSRLSAARPGPDAQHVAMGGRDGGRADLRALACASRSSGRRGIVLMMQASSTTTSCRPSRTRRALSMGLDPRATS